MIVHIQGLYARRHEPVRTSIACKLYHCLVLCLMLENTIGRYGLDIVEWNGIHQYLMS